MGNRIAVSRSTTNASRGRRLKIVVLGASGVGKTALFRRLLDQNNVEEEHEPTTSVNIGAKLILLEGQEPVLVELWDVPSRVYAGRAIFDSYLEGMDGALLVYDVASLSSWRTLIDYHALLLAHDTERKRPLVLAVIGNKVDTRPTASAEAVELANAWTIQQQQAQPQEHVYLHDTTVSATQGLHTLELLRHLVRGSMIQV